MLISSPINNLTPTLKITTVTCPSTFGEAEGSRNSAGRGRKQCGQNGPKGGQSAETLEHSPACRAEDSPATCHLPNLGFQVWRRNFSDEKSRPLLVRRPSAWRKDPGTLLVGGSETMRTEWALGWTVGGNRGGQSGRTVQRIALPRVTFPIWQVGHIEPRDS